MPKTQQKQRRQSPGRQRRKSLETPGDETFHRPSSGPEPELYEKFWRHLVAWETVERATPFDLLVQAGVELPPPGELDGDLGTKLREVIDALASWRIYLDHTDHLGDHELYTFLWQEELREESVFDPAGPYDQIIDVVGSGSREDIMLYLEYYADEEMRALWAEEWPDLEVPPHRDLPHDRDRHLPQPGWQRGRAGKC